MHMSAISWTDIEIKSTVSVSYTHLDVYKRQNMHLTKPTTINGINEAIAQVLNDDSEYQEQDKNLKKIN